MLHFSTIFIIMQVVVEVHQESSDMTNLKDDMGN